MKDKLYLAGIRYGKVVITECRKTGQAYAGRFIFKSVKGGLYSMPVNIPSGWGETPAEAVASLLAGRKKAIATAQKTIENAMGYILLLEAWGVTHEPNNED